MGVSAAQGSAGLKPGVCTSTTRPSNPFEGQMIYETDTDSTLIWTGSYWQSTAPRENLLHNGAMQVTQRSAVGTAVTGITGGGYKTADRYYTSLNTLGTWSQTTIADAPTGSGFRNSFKMACTTADASPAASDLLRIAQPLEGQDLQAIRKGTASAQKVTLSFWVKAFQTGTFICELADNDNSRSVSKAYTINASNTWEYKSLTFPADTTGTFDNDNLESVAVHWWLGAGSTYTSGTLATTWGTMTSANRAVGQTNGASSTSNTWFMTGASFTVGDADVPFQFKKFADDLRDCLRYFRQTTAGAYSEGTLYGYNSGATSFGTSTPLPVRMRATPTVSVLGTWLGVNCSSAAPNADGYVDAIFYYAAPTSTGAFNIRSNSSGYVTISADL